MKILLEEVSLYNGRRLLIVKVIHPYLRPDLGILGKEFYQSGMGGIQHILLIDNSGSCWQILILKFCEVWVPSEKCNGVRPLNGTENEQVKKRSKVQRLEKLNSYEDFTEFTVSK